MENSFKEIMRVSLSHTYFSKGFLHGFNIMPTATTIRAMKNYGILIRQNSEGIILLAGVESFGSDKPRIPLDSAGKFTFLLNISGPYFSNFTDLPLNSNSGEIFHFTNLNSNVQNADPLLTANTVKEFTTGDDYIKLKPKRFTHIGTAGGSEVTVEIKDENNSVLISEKVKVKDGKIAYNVDLVAYPPAKYKLFVSGVNKVNFYADDDIYSRKPFGIIDISISKSLPSAYSIIDSNGKITSKTYHIKFNPRKTFWKYVIVLKNMKTLDPTKLEINYPDNSNSFSRQADYTLPEGTTAVPFISAKEIEFNENVLKGIQLQKNGGNNSGWFDIENLPNASINSIKPDLPNDKIYSEIFIYI